MKTLKTIKQKTQSLHPSKWDHLNHYSLVGGQCGQSCPCCRAELYLKGIDEDAWFGACSICLKNKC